MQVLEDVHVTDLLRAADPATGGIVFDARVVELPSQGLLRLRTKAGYICHDRNGRAGGCQDSFLYERSKSCSHVLPSWQISQEPVMVRPSSLTVPV